MSLPWIMFILLIILNIFIHSCISNENSYFDVEPCHIDRCRLPYCYCSNQTIPGELTVRNTPQFIAITINGPTDEKTYNLLEKFFFSKKYFNPDGLFIF